MKNSYELEQIVKGFSNHYRIDILVYLKHNSGADLEAIISKLRANYKTISIHLQRMHRSGIIIKQYKGRSVEHYLTKRGDDILTFLGMLE